MKRHKPALSLDGNWFTFCGLLSPQRARLTRAIVAAHGCVAASLRTLPTRDVPHNVVYVITDYWVEALPALPRSHRVSALSLVLVTEFWLSEMLRAREWLDIDAHVFFTPPPRRDGATLRFAYPEDYATRMGVNDDNNSSTSTSTSTSTGDSDEANRLLMHLPCAPTHRYREQVPLWPYYVAYLHMPMRNIQELATVLKSISGTDPRRELASLEIALNDMLSPAQRALFFSTVLPEMARLVLQLPSLFASRPRVLGPFVRAESSSSGGSGSGAAPSPASAALHEQSVVFSKREALALVSSCFFGVFPSQNRRVAGDAELDFPYFTMRPLFQASGRSGDAALKAQKLRCVLAYFLRVVPLAVSADAADQTRLDTEVVTFTRVGVALPRTAASPLAMAPADVLAALSPHVAHNSAGAALAMARVRCEAQLLIEDLARHVQIDFANKFAGGGVFSSGCVQEEIRFVLSPELFVACLVFAKLEPHEAFVVHGSERFADYRGYGGSFEFAGDVVDTTDVAAFARGERAAGRPRAATAPEWRRRQCVIIGIDAVDYGGVSVARQYARPHIWRDVVKAYVGFAYADADARAWPVATGNWGCGVFRGDAELKFLIQWLAASLAQRELVYVLFERDQALHDSIAALLGVLDAVSDDSDRERVPLLVVQFLWSLDATLARRTAALQSAGKRAPRPSVLAQARDYLETQLHGLKRLKLSPSPPLGLAAAAAAASSQEPLASPPAPLSSSSAAGPARATDATHTPALAPARDRQESAPARTSSSSLPHRESKSLQQKSITQFFRAT